MLKRLFVIFALASVAAVSLAEAVRISGFVSGNPSGTKFTVGSSKGKFSVDATTAKITLGGKKFDLIKLTGGSQVTIEGELTGKTIQAKVVTIGNLRGAGQPVSTKPVTKTDPKAKTAGVASILPTKPKGEKDKSVKGVHVIKTKAVPAHDQHQTSKTSKATTVAKSKAASVPSKPGVKPVAEVKKATTAKPVVVAKKAVTSDKKTAAKTTVKSTSKTSVTTAKHEDATHKPVASTKPKATAKKEKPKTKAPVTHAG